MATEMLAVEKLEGLERERAMWGGEMPLPCADVDLLLDAARELIELRGAIVFDVRDTYTRRSIGMSDEAVFAKWRAGVVERGWQSPTAKGGKDG